MLIVYSVSVCVCVSQRIYRLREDDLKKGIRVVNKLYQVVTSCRLHMHCHTHAKIYILVAVITAFRLCGNAPVPGNSSKDMLTHGVNKK